MQPTHMLAAIEVREKTSQKIHTALGVTMLTLLSGFAGFAFWVMSSADQPGDFGVAGVHAAAVDATNSITLTWTAPGDDGATGQATSYDIRYSTGTLNEAAWGFATAVTGEPAPKAAGQAETYLVTNLQPNTTYNFALKTTDDAGNTSAISNIATKKTDTLSIPVCVENWNCTAWSMCTANSQTRTCTDLSNCGTTSNRPSLTRACTVAADGTVTLPSGQPANRNDIAPNTVITSAPTTAHTTPRFVFSWTGLDDVTAIENLQYSYRLDSRAWSGWSRTTQVTMRDLTNGRHTLYVRSRDTVGNIDPSPATTAFTVQLQSFVAVGVERGGQPRVRTYSPTGRLLKDLLAYESTFRGGVQVAAADLGDDGSSEIVIAPGSGRSGEVRIFRQDGSRINAFAPYGAAYRDGINITVADVNGDGPMEIITAKQKGSANIRVFGYRNGRFTQVYREFSAQVTGGVSLTAGDLNGDGKDEVITGPLTSGAASIRIFSLRGTSMSQIATKTNILGSRTGISIATGDLANDGTDEIIVGARTNAAPTIRVFVMRGTTIGQIRRDYTVYGTNERAGLRLSTVDANNDGREDLVVSYGGAVQPRLSIFSGANFATRIRLLNVFGTRDRLILNHSSGT